MKQNRTTRLPLKPANEPARGEVPTTRISKPRSVRPIMKATMMTATTAKMAPICTRPSPRDGMTCQPSNKMD